MKQIKEKLNIQKRSETDRKEVKQIEKKLNR